MNDEEDISRMSRRRLYESALSEFSRAKIDSDQMERGVAIARDKLGKANAGLKSAIFEARLARQRFTRAELDFAQARLSWSDADHFEWQADKGPS